MILSTKGRYAVMAMVDLAMHQKEKPVGLAAIADRQEIPLAYLEQIFAKLKRASVVQSVRGPGGGYTLAKPAYLLRISDIVEASEEAIKMTRCATDTHVGCMADKTRCVTHDLWEGLGEQIFHYLNSITLADVIGRKVRDKFPRDEHAAPHATLYAELTESLQPVA